MFISNLYYNFLHISQKIKIKKINKKHKWQYIYIISLLIYFSKQNYNLIQKFKFKKFKKTKSLSLKYICAHPFVSGGQIFRERAQGTDVIGLHCNESCLSVKVDFGCENTQQRGCNQR